MTTYSKITLNNLELSVNLGWPQGERVKQQIVTLDVVLHFSKPPLACTTDQLADTYCYHTLINTIKKNLEQRHFRLIEHLGFELYQTIRQSLSSDTRIQLRLTKKPAILNLTDGVTFCYGDE